MATNRIDEKYNYCRIKFQIQDAGNYSSNHADSHELVWGQFVAVSEGQANHKVIARSNAFPLPNAIEEQPFPDFQNVEHSNVLDNFIESLETDGWELSRPFNSDLWWEKRLRRPQRVAESLHALRQRLVTAFTHYG